MDLGQWVCPGSCIFVWRCPSAIADGDSSFCSVCWLLRYTFEQNCPSDQIFPSPSGGRPRKYLSGSLLQYNWQNCISLRYTTWCFGMHIHYDMIITIKVINASVDTTKVSIYTFQSLKVDANFLKICMEARRYFPKINLEKVMVGEIKCICPVYIVKVDWLGIQGYR